MDGSYYHVDVSKAAENGFDRCFLKSDEGFWGTYRWDVSSYPKCTDTADVSGLFPAEAPLPEEPLAEKPEAPEAASEEADGESDEAESVQNNG